MLDSDVGLPVANENKKRFAASATAIDDAFQEEKLLRRISGILVRPFLGRKGFFPPLICREWSWNTGVWPV